MSKRKGSLECQYCGKVMKTPKGRSAHEHMVHGHGMTPEAHAKAVERRRKRNARLEAESQYQSLADMAIEASLKSAMGEPLDDLEASLIFDD